MPAIDPSSMAEQLTPDLCVIGAGTGGFAVAAGAALVGVSVVLVERGRFGGGHARDVASKALIAAGARAEAVRRAARFGIDAEPAIDFARVRAHMEAAVAAAALNHSAARLTALGVQVVRGDARFGDADTVVVGETEIRAARFVIATGSSPATPNIPGLARAPYLTTDSALALKKLPQHLVVLGAGSSGVELAQAFRRLGAAVTVLESVTPLAEHDRECVGLVLDALAREDIALVTGDPRRVERARKNVRLVFAAAGGEETVEGSHLLVATGRRPNVDDLDLAAAGIAYDQRGIHVGRDLATINKRVYAVGDVTGAPQYAQVATFHATMLLRKLLFRRPIDVNVEAVPRVTFTDPELAHVGLAEADARLRHGGVRVLRWPYAENDRARAEQATAGTVKLVTTHRGRVVGASIVGERAGELIAFFSLAINKRMRTGELAELLPAAMTYAEVIQRVAAGSFLRRLTNPWVRRIIRLLRARR
jgi:pyruvate/2-oxoglutarate dehydrogenase complex dihydrolipoamide dehydrogenase (E3) component